MITKRSKRRHRGRLRPILHELDKIAKRQLKRSYLADAASWGGTRCPGCGINVRPHYLMNQPTYMHGQSRDGSPVFLDMTPVACKKMGSKCPGERQWG